jgi:riboflavin kinase/FMN adenylyltransferase
MTIIHTANELKPSGRKVCLAIGFFDGVHLGHQQIIRQTVTDARRHEAVALVITFDQHPNTAVAPHRVPPLIYSLPQKLRAIESLGVDSLLLIHFDKAFSEQTGEAFIRGLTRDLQLSTLNSPTFNLPIQSLCVGANFVFGHKRGGNVELLKKLGAELKFAVHGLAAVSLDGRAVSSTRIREAIGRGDLDVVSQMLGRAYSLAGTVVRGDGLGRQLGFPTANLAATGLALPPHGVYAVHVEVRTPAGPRPSTLDHPSSVALLTKEDRPSPHRAVMNIGLRPTLQNPSPQLRVEAHLLDFEGDLYGQELEIVFGEKLREEKKFGSLDELKEQIARDVDRARGMF